MEASAATPPPRSTPAPEGTEWLRILGGVAFGVGAVVLYIRKSGAISDDWADFPLLLVAAVPCALLFGLGVFNRKGGQVERWRSALMVLGVLLAPLSFEHLRETVGLSQQSSLWHFLVFSATAALAAYAAFVVAPRTRPSWPRSPGSPPGCSSGIG